MPMSDVVLLLSAKGRISDLIIVYRANVKVNNEGRKPFATDIVSLYR